MLLPRYLVLMYSRNKISNQRIALGKQNIGSKNGLEAVSHGRNPLQNGLHLLPAYPECSYRVFPLLFSLTVSQTKELKLRKLISQEVYFSVLEAGPDRHLEKSDSHLEIFKGMEGSTCTYYILHMPTYYILSILLGACNIL